MGQGHGVFFIGRGRLLVQVTDIFGRKGMCFCIMSLGVSWGELGFPFILLPVAFFCEVFPFAAVETKPGLVAVFFLFFRDLAFGGFEIRIVDMGRGPFLCRYHPGASRACIIAWGGAFLINSPEVIELLGMFYYARQHRWLGGNSQYLVVECLGESLSKGVHLGVVVNTRAGSMGGPFLVEIIKLAISHAHGVHLLRGF